MFPYLIASIALVAAVVVSLRTRKRAGTSVFAQVFGGLNVFGAGFLAFMTVAVLFLGMGEGLLYVSGFAVAVAMAAIWIRRGLVPKRTESSRVGMQVVGHILVLAGTIVHGSVTFYIPVLVWFGLLEPDASATLPWLGIFTTPIAAVVWAVGAVLIWGSTPNTSLERTREG